MRRVHLKRTRRLHSGHLWVFSNELYESPIKFSPGELVEVRDMQERFVGVGYVNPHSLIAIRLLTRKSETVDRGFLLRRIEAALRLRDTIAPERDACRLIYSEGDYLPGIIADRYGTCIVLQFLTYGMEAMKELVVELVDGLLQPETIVLRNDSRIRSLEGLPLYIEVCKGTGNVLPVIREDGLSFEVDPYHGQKTGFFLDQRENRSRLAHYIREGRGLDLFSYVGAWSMHLAAAGARVTCVDSSGPAIERVLINAGLNGLSDAINTVQEDVLSFLEREVVAGRAGYDFIVLDPPAFVKSASKLKEALKAYRKLNAMCMRLLRPGGILATSSCSYHVGKDLFAGMLNDAARDAERSPRLLDMRSQAPDHPILLCMPETEYLKCAFLVVD